MKRQIVALVCCRGGSKSIKNKNIKIFCKEPLIYWIYKSIKESKIFDRIILSTDSKKIAEIGKKLGFEIPGLRPKKLATSLSNQFDTHKHVFKKLNINDQNSIVCVVNNNPFINKDILRKSFKIFKNNKFFGIVIDQAKVQGDYLWWKQCLFDKLSFKYIFKNQFLKSKLNRQQLKDTYVGIFNIRWGEPKYLFSYNEFKKQLLRSDNKGIILKKIDNFDIDDMEDWYIAETVFNRRYIKKNKI
jgi:CMP-N-acetylneuraminic acid synthetase